MIIYALYAYGHILIKPGLGQGSFITPENSGSNAYSPPEQ